MWRRALESVKRKDGWKRKEKRKIRLPGEVRGEVNKIKQWDGEREGSEGFREMESRNG